MNRLRPCWAPIGTAARSGRPTHPRIHLFVRCGLSKGWYLRLSDHARPRTQHASRLFSPCAGAQVCPTSDILLVLDGAPNHRCGDLAVPYNSYHAPVSSALFPGTQSEGEKASGMNSGRKNLQELCPQIHGRSALVPSSGRPSSISSAIPSSSAPSPPSPISSTHSDVEVV